MGVKRGCKVIVCVSLIFMITLMSFSCVFAVDDATGYYTLAEAAAKFSSFVFSNPTSFSGSGGQFFSIRDYFTADGIDSFVLHFVVTASGSNYSSSWSNGEFAVYNNNPSIFTLTSFHPLTSTNGFAVLTSKTNGVASGYIDVSYNGGSPSLTPPFYITSYNIVTTSLSFEGSYISVNGGLPVVPDKPLQSNLYVGNGLLIDLSGQDSPVDIKFSGFGNYLGNATLWADDFTSGQSFYLSAAADQTSYTFNNNSYTLVPWHTDSMGLLGKVQRASYTLHIENPSGYLYVFNPLQSTATTIKTGQGVNSGFMVVSSDSHFASVKQFSLTSMSQIGAGQTIDITDDGNYYNDQGQLVDADGNPVDMREGGGNAENLDPENLGDYIRNTLNSFFESLQKIFAPASDAIHNLINAGSGFMQTLLGLYSWLPAEIVTVINSALVLFIVIGTLKLLI